LLLGIGSDVHFQMLRDLLLRI